VNTSLTVRAVTGMAVLAVGVVAWLWLHSGGDGSRPAPRATSSFAVLSAGALTGDVDGDGRSDVVNLAHDDTLHVRLGSGATVSQLLQDHPRLEGLADLGGSGLAVVVSRAGGHRSRAWTAWVVRGHRVVPVRTRDRAVLVADRGSSTVWVAGHRLHDGSLDPLQERVDRVAVMSRVWSLRDGVLMSRRVGVRCWDRSTTVLPGVCAPGQHWTYDVGPHGDLPALLPSVQPSWADTTHTTFGRETWLLRGGVLIHRSHGSVQAVQAVQVPRGWTPRLFRAPVRLADGAPGVLLSQEGGDSDTWRVYADVAGQVRQVRTRGPLPLGGGFAKTATGESVVYSWLTPEGRLFTRIGTPTPGRFRAYEWLPSGGTASVAPTLVAHELGTVCIDETLGTYGTCS
jgi:hypothetical protein